MDLRGCPQHTPYFRRNRVRPLFLQARGPDCVWEPRLFILKKFAFPLPPPLENSCIHPWLGRKWKITSSDEVDIKHPCLHNKLNFYGCRNLAQAVMMKNKVCDEIRFHHLMCDILFKVHARVEWHSFSSLEA